MLKEKIDPVAHARGFARGFQRRHRPAFKLDGGKPHENNKAQSGILRLAAGEHKIADLAQGIAAIAGDDVPEIMADFEMREGAPEFGEFWIFLHADAGFGGGVDQPLRREPGLVHEIDISLAERSGRQGAQPRKIAEDFFKLHRLVTAPPAVWGWKETRQQAG